MNILGLLKKKYHNEIDQRQEGGRERHQLNMTIDVRLIGDVKQLAAEFEIPRYIILEHSLETGFFYLSMVLKNDKKREEIHEHLINDHLLDSGRDDDEALLRIGEGCYASELLKLGGSVVKNLRSLKRVAAVIERTGNIEYFNKCKRRLLISALELAFWLESHPLDEFEST